MNRHFECKQYEETDLRRRLNSAIENEARADQETVSHSTIADELAIIAGLPAGAVGPQQRSAATRPECWTGQHCSVLLTDVAGFGAPTRTDQDRKIIREAMYRIVRDAFATAGISWEACHHEDHGDGILIVVPPHEPTRRIVYPVLSHIIGELSRHNARAGDGTSFQLRVALDVGPVESDDEGVTGKVIIDVARLIDAPAFKQKLAKAPPETCLGFIASDFVYDSIIKQQPGELAPATYQRIYPRVKGRRITAWVKLAPTI